MSLVWTMIAYFLYAEIAVVLLMVLPIVNAYRWNRLIKSKFMQMMAKQAHVYFYFVICVLVLFLLDSIREMRKYSTQSTPSEAHLNVELQHSLRLFRAQRNFYISGFAIFLVLVIRRLVTLISYQAFLLAQSEALLKQAQSASATLKKLMSEKKDNVSDKKDDPPSEGGTNKVFTANRKAYFYMTFKYNFVFAIFFN